MITLVKSIVAVTILAVMSLPAAADTAQINGEEIFFESVGNGPPLLVMHGGLGLSHDYLRPYFDKLAETHTVVYYDHFGNGRSGRPDDYAKMTFDRLVSDAAGLMDQLGHEQYTVIGHSYGGFIAQKFAAQNAPKINKLVLIDTVPAFDYKPTVSGTDEQMQAFGKLFGGPMVDDAEWRETWNLVVQMYFNKWDPEVGADLDERTVYEHRAWNAAGGLLATFNMIETLPEIKIPTLVTTGQHDGITPPEPGAERIASLMPNATLMIFEDSGHYPFIEERALFFEKVTNWLKQ